MMEPWWKEVDLPDPICMMCGELCGVTEVLRQPFDPDPLQLWCYCRKCQIDTFHPPTPITSTTCDAGGRARDADADPAATPHDDAARPKVPARTAASSAPAS
jgi:hypothetical protein